MSHWIFEQVRSYKEENLGIGASNWAAIHWAFYSIIHKYDKEINKMLITDILRH